MSFINLLIAGLSSVVNSVLLLLPNSPFTWNLGELSPLWKYVTFFIPIPEMITLTTSYCAAVLTWYGIRWVLRFAQYIQ